MLKSGLDGKRDDVCDGSLVLDVADFEALFSCRSVRACLTRQVYFASTLWFLEFEYSR